MDIWKVEEAIKLLDDQLIELLEGETRWAMESTGLKNYAEAKTEVTIFYMGTILERLNEYAPQVFDHVGRWNRKEKASEEMRQRQLDEME